MIRLGWRLDDSLVKEKLGAKGGTKIDVHRPTAVEIMDRASTAGDGLVQNAGDTQLDSEATNEIGI